MKEEAESNVPEILFDLALAAGRQYWTVGEVPSLTALAIYPQTEEAKDDDLSEPSNEEVMLELRRIHTERDHEHALKTAMESGQVETLNPITYMPNAAGVWLGERYRKDQLITATQIARFAATLRIRVTQLKSVRESESAAMRRSRLQQRVNDEKKKGTRGFNKVVAAEEKFSTTRLKQILKPGKDTPPSTWQVLNASSSKTSSKHKKT